MFNYTKFKQLVRGSDAGLSFAELYTELQRIREREEPGVQLPRQFRNNLATDGAHRTSPPHLGLPGPANDPRSAPDGQFDRSVGMLAAVLIALAYGVCLLRLAGIA